jgi:nickel-type superoxide dismutase maturation protease
MARLPFKNLPLKTIAVSGSSMSPTFNDGDWLLFNQVTVDANRLQGLVGKVVVIERESYPGIHLIKRVTKSDAGGIWVEGDNKESSSDSRQWGALTPTEIVGVVLLRYKRAK